TFQDKLPPEADEKWVKNALSNYGRILAVEIPKHRQHCENEGVCFVYFSRCDAVEKIVQYFDRQSRIFSKLKKYGVRNPKERSTTASSISKVLSADKCASQPLPLRIDMNDYKNSSTAVNDDRKLQTVEISSKSAEKLSPKRKLSAEEKSALVIRSKRSRKRSSKYYVDDSQIMKEDRNRDQFTSALGDQVELEIGDLSKSNARIVDGDNEKQSTSSSIDPILKQDKIGKSLTKRNKHLAGMKESGEHRLGEKKHEMNFKNEERD
uniref:RRM domain-containing protein n=1 Tax=Romanomermis culicivorax TaxID=13658 RepID=A0A915HIU5_ROMCU